MPTTAFQRFEKDRLRGDPRAAGEHRPGDRLAARLPRGVARGPGAGPAAQLPSLEGARARRAVGPGPGVAQPPLSARNEASRGGRRSMPHPGARHRGRNPVAAGGLGAPVPGTVNAALTFGPALGRRGLVWNAAPQDAPPAGRHRPVVVDRPADRRRRRGASTRRRRAHLRSARRRSRRSGASAAAGWARSSRVLPTVAST